MTDSVVTGGCACGAVRYQLTADPLFVHCCHCSFCQAQTGSAFALNALIESDRVELLQGQVEQADVSTPSGKGQSIYRCPQCKVAVWSHYALAGEVIAFVRVGTLDQPERFPPDVHIHTTSRLPWVPLAADIPAFEAYYSPKELWPIESQRRYREAMQA